MNISLEYLAGFFDGEGCVAVYRIKTAYILRVQITQNRSPDTEAIFNYLVSQFGGSYGNLTPSSYKDKLGYRLSSDKACVLLKSLMPFLILKREQAEMAVKWHESKPSIRRNKKGQICRSTKHFIKRSDATVLALKMMKR